jgi:hypothetical protein
MYEVDTPSTHTNSSAAMSGSTMNVLAHSRLGHVNRGATFSCLSALQLYISIFIQPFGAFHVLRPHAMQFQK